MVELTLIWNYSTQVLGPNGNISYPAQLLPMMIGLLSFLRICWLIFKRRLFPTEEGCDEDETSREKLGVTQGAPGIPQAGLGVFLSSPAYPEGTPGRIGEYDDESIVRNRSLVMRYTVAYLPWLSQFEFWKNPKGHRPLQSSAEEDGYNYNDTPLVGIQTTTRQQY